MPEEVLEDGPTMFFVENDMLGDDWCCFPSRVEAEGHVRACCQEIAEANVDPVTKLGNVPAFEGMELEAIVEQLFNEHVGSIEERVTRRRARPRGEASSSGIVTTW